MTKISYEERINLYYDRKNGMSFTSLKSKYSINKSEVEYIVRLIDKHEFDILRTNENKSYSSKEKERILNRLIMDNESILSVSIDEGLISKRMLNN
jgi:transposase